MKPQPAITVAIVEDQSDLRESLRDAINAAPGITCIAACANAEDALHDLPILNPQVLFMDINLPGMDGVECVRQLTAMMPGVLVVMLTIYDNTEAIFRSLEAGACGYLHKPVLGSELAAAARDVVSGASPMSGKIARLVIQAFQKPIPPTRETQPAPAVGPEDIELTSREQEVLHHLLEGCLYKEIADVMNVTAHTVNFHIQNIYRKLHCRSRAQLLAKYLGRNDGASRIG